jgi:hypothetical protein
MQSLNKQNINKILYYIEKADSILKWSLERTEEENCMKTKGTIRIESAQIRQKSENKFRKPREVLKWAEWQPN